MTQKRMAKRTLSSETEEQPLKRPCIESLLCTEDSLLEQPLCSDSEEEIEKEVVCIPLSPISSPNCESQEEELEDDDALFDQNNMRRKDLLYKPKVDVWSIQKEVRPDNRAVLIDWIYEVADNYELQRETTMIAVSYLDRILALTSVAIERLQLLGATCLFIAIKFQEITPMSITDMASLCDTIDITPEAILEMEMLVTSKLEWNLSPSTSFTWLRMFLESCRVQDTQFPYSVLIHATQLIEYFYLHPGSVEFTAGTIAASGFCLYALRNAKTEELEQITGFKASETLACRELLCQMEGLFLNGDVHLRLEDSILRGSDEQIHNPQALDYVRALF